MSLPRNDQECTGTVITIVPVRAGDDKTQDPGEHDSQAWILEVKIAQELTPEEVEAKKAADKVLMVQLVSYYKSASPLKKSPTKTGEPAESPK